MYGKFKTTFFSGASYIAGPIGFLLDENPGVAYLPSIRITFFLKGYRSHFRGIGAAPIGPQQINLSVSTSPVALIEYVVNGLSPKLPAPVPEAQTSDQDGDDPLPADYLGGDENGD